SPVKSRSVAAAVFRIADIGTHLNIGIKIISRCEVERISFQISIWNDAFIFQVGKGQAEVTILVITGDGDVIGKGRSRTEEILMPVGIRYPVGRDRLSVRIQRAVPLYMFGTYVQSRSPGGIRDCFIRTFAVAGTK